MKKSQMTAFYWQANSDHKKWLKKETEVRYWVIMLIAREALHSYLKQTALFFVLV